MSDAAGASPARGGATHPRTSLLALGTALLVIAGVVSNGAIEAALRGNSTGALAWGSTLFRGLLAIHGLFLLRLGFQVRPQPKLGADEPLRTEPGQERERFPWALLIALSSVAAVLRLWKLESDLWIDEILTLVDYVRPPLGEIATSFATQNQHMLYSLLAHVSIDFFGESASAVRLPSVVFAVASVWALFLLGRLVVGVKEALLACALMTVSYHHIWFSQNARGYMGLLLFSILSTWLWLEALSRAERRFWVGYTASVILGMWVHLTFAFVVAAHGLVFAAALLLPQLDGGLVRRRLADRSTRWAPVLAWVLSTTLTLQIYALSLPEFLREALGEVSLESEWTNPLWVVAEALRSLQVGFSGMAVVVVGIVLVGSGFWSILRRDFHAVASMTLPACLCGGTMLVLGHNLWPRFFFFSMGFGLLITVRGAMVVSNALLSRLSVTEPRRRLAGTAMVILMIAASAASLPGYYSVPKQDFTGARDFVEANRGVDEEVVAVGLAALAYSRYYAPEWPAPEGLAELDRIRNMGSQLWLVYTLPIQLRAFHPETWAAVERDFEVVEVFPGSLGNGHVYVCRERPLGEI